MDYIVAKAPLHSINFSLPPELITKVFLHFRGSPKVLWSSFSLRDGPLPLTHVCSRWREIALDTPELWTLITVESGGLPRYEPRLELMKLWLSRSRFHLLDVIMIVSGPGVRTLANEISIENLVMRQSYRWRSLDLIVNNYSFLDRIQMFRNNLSVLQECHIRETRPSFPQPSRWLISLFHTCPKLRIFGVNSGDAICSVSMIPFTQFTVLDLKCSGLNSKPASANSCIEILKRCPMLQIFRVRLGWKYSGSDEIHPTVSHSHLRVLDISGESTQYVSDFDGLFSHMSLPRLQVLHIDPLGSRYSVTGDTVIVDFLVRHPYISSLALYCPYAPGISVMDYLCCLPAIKHLDLCIRDQSALFIAGQLMSNCPYKLPKLYYYVCTDSAHHITTTLLNKLAGQQIAKLRNGAWELMSDEELIVEGTVRDEDDDRFVHRMAEDDFGPDNTPTSQRSLEFANMILYINSGISEKSSEWKCESDT